MKKHSELSKLKMPILLSIMLAAFVPLSGCDRDEGGMEESGENIDDAMTDFGNAVEDKCEEAKSGANAKDTDC